MLTLKTLSTIFKPEIATEIHYIASNTDHHTIGKIVTLCFEKHASPSRASVSHPTGIPDFIQTLSQILTSNARDTIVANLRDFDKLCGVPVVDDFIQQLTFGGWLHGLGKTLEHENDTSTTLSSLQSTKSSKSATMSSTTTAPSSLQKAMLDGTAEEETRIIQVDLSGPSILHAFKHDGTIVGPLNTTLRSLESNGPGPLQDWTPSQASGYPVFHGTSAHFDHPEWPNSWADPVLDLYAENISSQMAPLGVPVVYTAFSPLRSFLWAAFESSIYRNIPGPNETSSTEGMNQNWMSNGKDFRGVAVFQFHSAQPSPSNLSWASIPPGRETEWASTVQGLGPRYNVNPQKAWKEMQKLRKPDTLDTWPDVLHGLEFGQQKHLLQQFRVNMWRTAWLEGSAVNRLNASYVNTMAITFHLVEAPKITKPVQSASKPPPKKDEEDEGSKRKSGKELFKRASGYLKKGFGSSSG